MSEQAVVEQAEIDGDEFWGTGNEDVSNGFEDGLADISEEEEEEVESENIQVENETEEEEEPEEQEVEEEPKEPVKRKYNIVVDGKQEEIEVDDNEIIKHIQISRSSDQRYRMAADLHKKAQDVVSAIKERGPEVLQKMGWNKEMLLDYFKDDLLPLAAEDLERRLELEMMTPEQRAYAETQDRLKKREREIEELRQKENQRQFETAKESYKSQHQAAMTEAIASEGLPDNKETRAFMANMAFMKINNNEPIYWDQIAKAVGGRMSQQKADSFEGLTAEEIMERLGPEKLDAIRKAQNEKIKTIRKKPVANKPATKKSRTRLQRMSDLQQQLDTEFDIW